MLNHMFDKKKKIQIKYIKFNVTLKTRIITSQMETYIQNESESDEVQKESEVQKGQPCPKHPDCHLSDFCDDCKLFICNMCKLQRHAIHKIKQLIEVKQVATQELSVYKQKLINNSDLYNCWIKELGQLKSESYEEILECEHKVTKLKNEFISTIEEDSRILLEKLQQKNKDIQEEYSRNISDLEQNLDKQTELLQKVEDYLENYTVGLFNGLSELKDRLSEETEDRALVNTEMNVVKFDVISSRLTSGRRNSVGHIKSMEYVVHMKGEGVLLPVYNRKFRPSGSKDYLSKHARYHRSTLNREFNWPQWKRVQARQEPDAVLQYFWDNFNADNNMSIWKCQYKCPEELTFTFKTSNLVRGMFHLLEGMKKCSFGSMCIFGEDHNNTVVGVWCWNGQELPVKSNEEFSLVCDSYTWNKLNTDTEETKTLVRQFFTSEDPEHFQGKMLHKKFYFPKVVNKF